MVRRTEPIESLLGELGRAQRESAFSSDSERYPWRMDEPVAESRSHRHFGWARVAVPLAAAAAVAVLFVGPSLFETNGVHEMSELTVPSVVSNPMDVSAEMPAVDDSAATTAEAVDCDYNGDGRIDGQDIQAFLDRATAGADGDLELETEFLQRCLLGSD